MDKVGGKLNFNSPYHPQTQGPTEGFNVSDLFENHGRTPTSTDVEALPLSAAMKIISEDIEEILDVWESGKHQVILFLSQRDRRLLHLHLASSRPDHHHLPDHHPLAALVLLLLLRRLGRRREPMDLLNRRRRRPSPTSPSSTPTPTPTAHPDGARMLRLSLPKAEIARLMHESTDATRKIMDLWVARNQHPSPTTPDRTTPTPLRTRSAARSCPRGRPTTARPRPWVCTVHEAKRGQFGLVDRM
uniref:Uncharacterized protein n=1 Tax=Ananas comosus var. bracteatus TaxID=296719 RepID=A0A6V7Q6R3_ANACO|nr:unnamed protein product [Ananas comosus var. bracteatus]